jgi:hypothetical protein
MKKLLPLLLLIAALASWAGPAYGCSCAIAEPKQMLEWGPVAFVGTIGGVAPGGQGEFGAQHVLTYQVETVFAGEVPAEVDIVTADNSAACGIDAVVGTRMAVFATDEGGRLTAGLCSITDAETAIQALGPGTPPVAAVDNSPPFDWQVVWLGAGGLVLVVVAWLLTRRRSA